MKRNGKTSKIIEFKGQKVLLHSFSVLMKSIGKSKNTILKYERFGLLPRPMFTYDESRWYTEYELAVLADCKYRYSVPFEVYDDRKYKFFDELQKGWASIRKSLMEGTEPDIPVILEFKSKAELLGLAGKDCLA